MAILDQLFGLQPQQGQGAGGLVQSILSQRFQPSPEDINQATAMSGISRNYVSPSAAMQQRMSTGMQGEQLQAEQLKNRMTEFQMPLMQDLTRQLYGGVDTPPPPVGFPQPGGASPSPQSTGNAPPVGFPTQKDPRIAKAETAAMLGNKALSEALMADYNADPNVIQQKSRSTKMGEQNVEDTVQARGTQDVIGIYNKLKTEATQAPGGLGENIWADVTNAANMPSQGAIARGGYEADLNNLYLGMIRSLKGTGRVMQAELDELKNAQPKSTDSVEVKQSKIDAHMRYYTNRMTELGYDPSTGNPLGNNQLAPHNLQDIEVPGSPSSGSQLPSGWTQEEFDTLTPEEKASLK